METISGTIKGEQGRLWPVKRAFANIAASTTAGEVVAAVTGKRIRVLSVAFVAGGTATDATFKSGSTVISALFANAANSGAVLPYNPHGWFETKVSEALNLLTGTGATTGVHVVYALAD